MDLLFANDRPGAYPASWYAETAPPLTPFLPLDGPAQADVCVIGAGYTGMSAALHLVEAGHSVILLDAQRVAFGASGRNGGQVGSGQRQDQDWLERHAPDAARALWDLAEESKALVQRLIARHAIDAAWRPGVAHAFRKRGDAEAEQRYAVRLARDYGYDRIEPLDRTGIRALIGSERFAGGTLDHGAGHLHPLRFGFGLARAAAQAGVTLHERSRVTGIDGATVHTETGSVRAEHIVLATNGYLGDLDRAVAARVMPINNFILATEPLDARADGILARDVAVADDRFVVNYWRLSEDRRLLFGGGESYGYRFPRDIAAVVRKPMLEIYPQLADVEITHAWGGTLAITRNRMPHFARRGRVWSASGYSGHGVAMAVMAGQVIARAVRGDTGPFDAMARMPAKRFPGGVGLRTPLLALAMTWFALRDRFGI